MERKIENVNGRELKSTMLELYNEMDRVLAHAKSIGNFILPDGRECQVQINIEAEEDNFI